MEYQMDGPSTPPPALIYQLMPLVAKDIGFIGKDRKNKTQNYSFRGIDDFLNGVHNPFTERGITAAPCVTSFQRDERKMSGGSTVVYTTIMMDVYFYAPDGSFIKTTTIGEGMDGGDKSANKAMSAAFKYACVMAFTVPTEDPKSDSENDSWQIADKEADKPIPDKPADGAPENPKKTPPEPLYSMLKALGCRNKGDSRLIVKAVLGEDAELESIDSFTAVGAVEHIKGFIEAKRATGVTEEEAMAMVFSQLKVMNG